MFRTPIGFHDAYVAAPSQKAALEAWGSDANLFAREAAEEVTDPDLTKAPLEQPGVVFRRLRGSEKEQMEALGRDASAKTRKKGPRKPSRSALDQAEEALEALEKAQRDELAALDKKRQELERRHARDIKAGRAKERRVREEYEDAVREWETM